MQGYERLSGLDSAFLGFETRNAYMHVAVTAIFDAGPLRTATGGVDVARVKRHFAARLSRLPRFRQRLAHVPLMGDPVWVDDEHFDLGYHLRHVGAPRPGRVEQLQRCTAEILERPLNRARPLWESWIVEGLEGDAFALIVKVHHCIVDGIAGIGMLVNLLDPTPREPPAEIAPWQPRPAPSAPELLRGEMRRRWRGTLAAGRAVAGSVAHPADAVERVGEAAADLWSLVRRGLSPAPACFFNHPIGPHRQIGWIAFPLARVKRLKQRLGGTVNDVVLTAVGGALGHALRRRHDPAGHGELRVVVPVSVRSAEELGTPGNRVSLWLVPLPTDEPDPLRRLERIRRTTDELKRGGAAAGGTVITEAASWAGGAAVAMATRLINTARLYNAIVTNVPGPDCPLYLLGARLKAAYPHLPLFENQGLGIALLSFDGQLHVGITADWEHGALVGELARSIESELTILELLTDDASDEPGRAAAG